MEDLVIKYRKELDDINPQMVIPFVKSFEETIKFIDENITPELKIPSMYIVKEIHLNKKYNEDDFLIENIEETIIKFIEFYNDEYEKYIAGFKLISDQHFTNLCFYDKFIKMQILD